MLLLVTADGFSRKNCKKNPLLYNAGKRGNLETLLNKSRSEVKTKSHYFENVEKIKENRSIVIYGKIQFCPLETRMITPVIKKK
jgi:hypothetical protein